MVAMHTMLLLFIHLFLITKHDNCWLELIMNRRIQIFHEFLSQQIFTYLRLKIN